MANASTPGSTPGGISSTAAFSTPPLNQLLNQITTIKLDRGNYLLWKNLALPILHSYKLEGHLLGTKPCPPATITQTTGDAINNVAPTTVAGVEASSFETPGSGASSSMTTISINPLYEAWMTTDQLLLG